MGKNNINLLTDCQQSNSLVFAKNGNFFTTSEAIAQGTNNEHRAVLQMIDKYQDKFDRFGGVAFEMIPFETAGGIQSKRIALLNNSQATFLMTLLKNNDVVVDFKVRLVEEFEKLAEKAKQAPTPTLPDFTDPEQALLFALDKLQENKKLLAITHEQAGVIERKDALIELQKPKVEFANVVIESDTASPLNEASKKIANHNPKCTPNKTRDLMKIKGFLIANEKRDYMPSAAMTMNGYMQYKLVKTWFDREADKTREQWQVRITGKGLEMMLRLCKNYAKFFDYKFQEYEYYLRNPHSEQTKEFLTKIREASKETSTNELLV